MRVRELRGHHTIRWTLTRTGRATGHGELFVDDESVGAIDIPRIIRGFAAFSGMSVGCDLIAPVGTTYESPFRFTGAIDRIEVDVDDGTEADSDAEMRNEMGKQ